MKPDRLRVAGDYCLALLWLMARLGSGRIGDVMAAFETEFGDLIPEAHREENKSGRIKWQHYVMWARFELVKAGLMASGGRGLWGTAPAGEEWLRRNPAADPSELSAFLRQGDAMTDATFTWRGEQYGMDKLELLARAGRLLKAGPPPEAVRYLDWAVLVDGQPVSAKWLFALVTGADYNQFDSPTARRALARIGIRVQRVDAEGIEPAPAAGPDKPGQTALRDEFLDRVAGHLRARLPQETGYSAIRHYPRRNWVQVFFPGFGSCHYELWLARGHDEVGLHLEGKPEQNRARLAILAPHTDEFAAALGQPVVAVPWGANWAKVAIEMVPARWTDETAHEYASLLARFVEVTLPAVREAVASREVSPRARTVAKPPPAGQPDGRTHAILDQLLMQVRAFLQGRSSRPSDEVLCEWVQFCYTFELFAEGAELFRLIVPGAVHEWLYARTSRLAQVCRMRASNKA